MEMVQFRMKDQLFFIRLIGRLEFKVSAALDLVFGWIKNDKTIKRVVVDLGLATSIDSTNLGLLAQLGLYCNQKHGYVPILAAGSTPEVKQTLSQLQLSKLYRWKGDAEEFGLDDDEFIRALEPIGESETRICERAIGAHQALMSLSESNRAEFTSVIAGLQIERAMLDHGIDQEFAEVKDAFADLENLELNQPTIPVPNTLAFNVH